MGSHIRKSFSLPVLQTLKHNNTFIPAEYDDDDNNNDLFVVVNCFYWLRKYKKKIYMRAPVRV